MGRGLFLSFQDSWLACGYRSVLAAVNLRHDPCVPVISRQLDCIGVHRSRPVDTYAKSSGRKRGRNGRFWCILY